MEILARVISSLVEQVTVDLCTCICSSTKSTALLKSNLDDLERKMKTLMDLRNDVQNRMESTREERKSETKKVEKWLREVEELVKKYDSMKTSMEAGNQEHCGCCGRCLRRYMIGREVREILGEVERLQRSGNKAKKAYLKAVEAKTKH